jgi:hypothetical protein
MLDNRGAPEILRRLLVAAIAIVMWGCASVTTPNGDIAAPPASVAPATSGGDASAVAPATPAESNTDGGVSGVWQGISVSDCVGEPSDPGRCSAMQRITLTMFQRGAEVTGFYRCAYGNQVCRHLNETGVIHNGTLSHTRLMMRIMHEDGSMCFFTGRPAGNRLDGGYECLQGGGIVEQGTFQTQRTY